MLPTWSGLDPGAFIAGFGIAEWTGAVLFAFLISFVMVRKLLSAAGL
jgi:hypothetical protein